MSIEAEIRNLIAALAEGEPGRPGLPEALAAVRREGIALAARTCGPCLAEYRHKLGLLTRNALLILIGWLLITIGILALAAAAVMALALALPPWVAFFIVGLLLIGAGISRVVSMSVQARCGRIAPPTRRSPGDRFRWLLELLGNPRAGNRTANGLQPGRREES